MTNTPVIHDHDTVAVGDDVDVKRYEKWLEAKASADEAAATLKAAAKEIEDAMKASKVDVLLHPVTGKAMARTTITDPKPVLDTKTAVVLMVDAGITPPMRTPAPVTKFTVQKP